MQKINTIFLALAGAAGATAQETEALILPSPIPQPVKAQQDPTVSPGVNTSARAAFLKLIQENTGVNPTRLNYYQPLYKAAPISLSPQQIAAAICYPQEFNPTITRNTPLDEKGQPLAAEQLKVARENLSAGILELTPIPSATIIPVGNLSEAFLRLTITSPASVLFLTNALRATYTSKAPDFSKIPTLFDTLCANPYLLAIWRANLSNEVSLNTALSAATTKANLDISLAIHTFQASSLDKTATASERAWNDFFTLSRNLRRNNNTPLSKADLKLYENALADAFILSENYINSWAAKDKARATVLVQILTSAALLTSPELDCQFLEISKALVGLAHKMTDAKASPELEKKSTELLKNILTFIGQEAISISTGNDLNLRTQLFYSQCIESCRQLHIEVAALALPPEQSTQKAKVLGLLRAEDSTFRDYIDVSARQTDPARVQQFLANLWESEVCKRSKAADFGPNNQTHLTAKLLAVQCLDPRAYPATFGEWAGLTASDQLPNMNVLFATSAIILVSAYTNNARSSQIFFEQRAARIKAYENHMHKLSTEGVKNLREKQQIHIRQLVVRLLNGLGSNSTDLNEHRHMLDATVVAKNIDTLLEQAINSNSLLGADITQVEIYRSTAGRILSSLALPTKPGAYQSLVEAATWIDYDLGQHDITLTPQRHAGDYYFISSSKILALLQDIKSNPNAAMPAIFEFLRSSEHSAREIEALVENCLKEKQFGQDPRVTSMSNPSPLSRISNWAFY